MWGYLKNELYRIEELNPEDFCVQITTVTANNLSLREQPDGGKIFTTFVERSSSDHARLINFIIFYIWPFIIIFFKLTHFIPLHSHVWIPQKYKSITTEEKTELYNAALKN